MFLTLIDGGEIYGPEPSGVQAILLCNERILKVGKVDAATSLAPAWRSMSSTQVGAT